ncbi:sigma-70 family RNA polymerase sigma factor [Singulisphaera sp. Ch08]|uniref:Sigma-70 family RNA polymerase sigma factor n=1 Tax=Singulisphaera sp. Ch08 TaxID=3120278 RepID=A0AAU7CNW5_9BACT
MAGGRRGLTQRQIHTLFDVGPVAGLSDGQLLERFATRSGEGAELAFAALVDRHGPMVLHVSRAIVRDDHEAMDVFQATFLVLARKGRTLWVRDSLGPWLHRVACRAASRARHAAARRRRIEARRAAMADPRDCQHCVGDAKELAAIIHEELNRLPERFRSPVVLCDLEGHTCEEAARHLGCPVGTVASRLARARQRLRDRLRRRGLAPNTSLIAAAMSRQGPSTSISAALARSTANAAVQFVSIGAANQGAAVSLALELLHVMSISHWIKVTSLLLVMSGSATGLVAFAVKDAAVDNQVADAPPKIVGTNEIPGLQVKPGQFKVRPEQIGRLEASQTAEVFSLVEGQTKILSIVPEGTRLKKGEIVCELDSAAIRDHLTKQQVTQRSTEAAYNEAKLAREFAERGLKEYEEQIYPRELELAEKEILMAEERIEMADERVKRARNASDRLKELLNEQKGTKTAADIIASLDLDDRVDDARLRLQRERKALDIGRTNRSVLERTTRTRTIRQLRDEVKTAISRERAEHIRWEGVQSRTTFLQRQIENCRILAPSDGSVVYANDPNRIASGDQAQIQKGAIVRERQKLFSIPELDGPMRVLARFPEAIVDRITPGLPAKVEVHAFPDQLLEGVVENVAPLPDPSSYFNKDKKVYTTYISIMKGTPGLRPGLTADVSISLADLENVLTVPNQAVVRYENQDHVAVKTAERGIEWRVVTLGLSDGKRVEVKEGLNSGETIVPEPAPLLSDEQKEKISRAPSQSPARRKTSTNRPTMPPALLTKFQALSPEARQQLGNASPRDRELMLKKLDFTDVEIRQLNPIISPANPPR